MLAQLTLLHGDDVHDVIVAFPCRESKADPRVASRSPFLDPYGPVGPSQDASFCSQVIRVAPIRIKTLSRYMVIRPLTVKKNLAHSPPENFIRPSALTTEAVKAETSAKRVWDFMLLDTCEHVNTCRGDRVDQS